MELSDKYRAIEAAYRAGECGSGHLSVHEMLRAAGEPTLLREMSVAELKALRDECTGAVRSLFSVLIAERETAC